MAAGTAAGRNSAPRIDLNSDVGESFGNWRIGDDTAILGTVSSANIACGFHAGDPLTIQATARTAAENDVAIGAHIGYRDLAGFGRRHLECSYAELAADVRYQLGALQAMAGAAGARIRYVKPHGALYHSMIGHEVHSRAVIDTIASFDPELPVLLLPGSIALDHAAEAGLRGVAEAFADRNYNPDGTLVSRREPDAVLHETGQVVENMLRLAQDRQIIARDGTRVPVEAESICVHGDTAGAVEMAHAVRTALEEAGVEIRSFVA
ncbi:5-oxoprolinase subunit PxpA [Nesterenkonia sp. HG001]|uniref:LamB/YcsF family protein n=1 Tax=Nesterenkonia sp. HG001 TaxID=2983207 RepID=UPI002AC3DBFF|nr:5-oxoprolinase subunit PxpA [Nesterenkonia sp. HG001]MDZ5077754.1 LamB/YcsF family protein [Nesterenkonia sp. HG001]